MNKNGCVNYELDAEVEDEAAPTMQELSTNYGLDFSDCVRDHAD
jgi:antitoxin component of RelBE/YafQ-DinJ toxin-antitoxin module